MLRPFELHQSYHRRNDIHARVGGPQEGGILTPTITTEIFILPGMVLAMSAIRTFLRRMKASDIRARLACRYSDDSRESMCSHPRHYLLMVEILVASFFFSN